MLHPRDVAHPDRATALERLTARLAAVDPGLLRLQLSLRGTASVVLTTLAAMAAGHLGGFNPVECAGAITLSMMAPFLSREPTLPQRIRTLAILAVPAVGASVLTTFLHGHGPAGDSLFLLLVFAGFLLGPRSSRGVAIGLVALITTYVGLYLELPPATLPIQVAAPLLALPVIAFACFVLVPIDPARTLRHAVTTVGARAARLLHHAGAGTDNGNRRLRRDLLGLTEAALAADDQLALLDPGIAGVVRNRLVDVELWAARLGDALPARPSPRELRRVALHATRIASGRPYATEPSQFPSGSAREALVGLGTAVQALARAARLPRGTPATTPPALSPGPLAWRVAIRVTLAAALAMAGGMILSPQRWFWAVITVYVMFINVRTRGDTLHKGAQRVAGTLLGLGVGLLLATLASGDTVAEIAVLVGSVWAMYYFFLVSYTVGIFFVTVMLGILYGLLGVPVEEVLALRVEETAIGAVAAILVAFTVLPSRTRDQVRRSGLDVVARLAVALRDIAGLVGPTPPDIMRAVDRGVADLKLALAPLVAGRTLLRRTGAERRASALLDCVHWTRLLAAEHPGTLPDQVRLPLVANLCSVADRLDTLARGDAPPLTNPGEVSSVPANPTPLATAAVQLDQAVAVLAERLGTAAHDAFALGR